MFAKLKQLWMVYLLCFRFTDSKSLLKKSYSAFNNVLKRRRDGGVLIPDLRVHHIDKLVWILTSHSSTHISIPALVFV